MCLKYVMKFASTFNYYIFLPGAFCSVPVKRHTFLCVTKNRAVITLKILGFTVQNLIALATRIPEMFTLV